MDHSVNYLIEYLDKPTVFKKTGANMSSSLGNFYNQKEFIYEQKRRIN